MKKWLFLPLSVLLPLCVAAQIDSGDQARIDSLFQRWDNEKSPGAVIGIIKEGELIYSKGYGMANLKDQVALDANTGFDIASTSKQFTAAAIAMLYLEGKIGLDDDIRQYIPEMPDYGESITIRHLVHHTNGLRDYLVIIFHCGNVPENFSPADGIEVLARQKALNFPPGDQFLYTNSGYLLMAEIVNRASGTTLRKYTQEKIFKELGMNNTFFDDDYLKGSENRALGYFKKNKNKYRNFEVNGNVVGAAGLVTTVNDLFLWDQNFYDKKVGGQDFYNLMLQNGILNNGDTIHYAFGLNHGSYRKLKTVYHAGGGNGIQTQFIRFPEQRFSVIVFTNAPDLRPNEKASRIAEILLNDEIIATESRVNQKDKPWQYEVSKSYLDQFSGLYWNYKGNYSRRIYLKNDTLRYFRNDQNESHLVPVSRDEFKMEGVGSEIFVKFQLEENTPHKMSLFIDDRRPIESTTYKKASYTDYSHEELTTFSGYHTSSEMGCDYHLKLKKNSLVLYYKKRKVATLDPTMKNIFRLHDYSTFRFDTENTSSFTVTTERVKNVIFEKR